jgi:hypothetical protein
MSMDLFLGEQTLLPGYKTEVNNTRVKFAGVHCRAGNVRLNGRRGT